jgi:hypothetical protein
MTRIFLFIGLLVGWTGCRSSLLTPRLDAGDGGNLNIVDMGLVIADHEALDSDDVCHDQPLTQTQAIALFQAFVFQENPAYNPNSQFTVEEHTVLGACQAMGIQLFTGGTLNEGYLNHSRPFVAYKGKIFPLTHGTETRLLSAVLVGTTLYYSVYEGSGINYTQLGKVSLIEESLYVLPGPTYPRFDASNLFLRISEGQIGVEIGYGQTFNTWTMQTIFGRLQDQGQSLAILDSQGKEIAPQGVDFR